MCCGGTPSPNSLVVRLVALPTPLFFIFFGYRYVALNLVPNGHVHAAISVTVPTGPADLSAGVSRSCHGAAEWGDAI